MYMSAHTYRETYASPLLQVVEQTIMASGLLLLMGAGLVLVVRDITNLKG